MAGRNNNQSITANEVFANALFIALAVAVGALLLWDAAFFRLVNFAPNADYWEHTAVLNEWMRNFPIPGNPHVIDPAPSPLFTPYSGLLAFVGLLFQFDAFVLMAFSAVINYLLIVFGLHLFMKAYFRDAWAPLAGFFAIFFLWGVSLDWANLYHLRSFLYIAGVNSTFVFGLCLISFAVVIKLLRSESSVILPALLLLVLVPLMFICHPLTALFGISGCALLALTEPADSRSHRITVLVLLAAGMLAAEFWTYFSPWKIALGLYTAGSEETLSPFQRFSSGDWQHVFYEPALVAKILGPGLLGIPLCILLWRRREFQFITWGVVLMCVPVLLNMFIPIPDAQQFVLFAAIYLQLAIVWGILFVIDAWRTVPRPDYAGPAFTTMLAGAGFMLVLNVWMLTLEFGGKGLSPYTFDIADRRALLPDDMATTELYTQLADPLQAGTVVLTSARLGWPLPSFKGKVVALFRPNPLLEDQQQRYQLTGDFFYKPLSASARAEIIRRYDATHILTSYGDKGMRPELYSWLVEHAAIVGSVGYLRMHKLHSSAIAAAPAPVEIPARQSDPGDVSHHMVVDDSAVVQQPVSLPAAPPRQAPVTEAAEAVEGGGGFGAPIAAPIIQPVEAPPEQAPERAAVTEELPAALLAPRERNSEQPGVSKAVKQPEVYGAPIADPVLDPERHGG